MVTQLALLDLPAHTRAAVSAGDGPSRSAATPGPAADGEGTRSVGKRSVGKRSVGKRSVGKSSGRRSPETVGATRSARPAGGGRRVRTTGGAAAPTAGGARASASPGRGTRRGAVDAVEPADWRLDDHTREIGLRGVAEARRALAAAVERVGTAA
jgi:hypothetical protein